MTTIDIYRVGSPLITLDIDEKTIFTKKLQGEHNITSEYIHSGASGLDLTIGDYITYPASGENYTINRLPTVTKINNSTFKYNISFEANSYNLNKKLLISSDELADFAYNGSPADFLDVILENINEIDPTWTTASGTNTSGEDKTLQFVNDSCMSALSKVAEAYDFEYDINNRVISLQDSISGASGYTFRYGEASGLYKIERQQVVNQNIITRCYGFGSTKNIPYTYRAPSGGTKRLVFEASGFGYLDSPSASALYGIIEGQYTDDSIYPHRTGTLTGVVFAASGTGDWDTNTDYLVDSAMDFDVNDYLLEGQTATIVFKSGDLSGVECEIWKYDNAASGFYITPFIDTDAATRPNSVNYPTIGDSYTIVNISMPQTYIDTAEAALQAATQAYLDKYSVPQVVYAIDIDPKYATGISLDISVGDKVTIIDTDLGIDSLIRISGIEFPLVNPYKIKATIADFVPYTMQERIIKSAISNSKETVYVDKNNRELSRLNTVNRVYSQDQLALKAPIDSPIFTTQVTLPALTIIPDGGTLGQASGPLLTFDDTSNFLKISGASLGIGTTASGYKLEVNGTTKGIKSLITSNGWAGWIENSASGAGSNSGLVITAGDDSVDSPLLVRNRIGDSLLKVCGDGDAHFYNNVQEPDFTAGWFGDGWQVTQLGNFDIENLLVRGSARFRELIIDQLAVLSGSQLLSVARGKILSVDIAASGITLDDPNEKGACAFIPEDFFWIKTVDIDHGLFSDVRGQITAVSGVDLTISFAASGANGAIEDIAEGDVIVQRGHPSSGLRQNLMYTTVSDSDAPFHRTITGVNSLTAFDELSNVVLQTGNLASLDSHDIVPASPGYGIYSDNAYLKGLIQAASGDIGGLTLAANAIYTGIIHTSDNYSASGTTLASDGGFHAENFYINADGVVGINQEQPHWVPKVASDTLRHSSDAQVETNSESYVIKKTIVFPNGLKGVARFKFSLAVEVNLASTADGAIYDGDDRIGTIQSTSSSSPVTKSEDITHDFAPGASCHLKIGTSDSDYAAYASNFRIYYSDGTPVVAVLSDWTLE